MNFRQIVFPARQTVTLIREPVGAPADGELLIEATRTLVSTGTEMTVFNQLFEKGTHWEPWAEYPFKPGYLMAGRVIGIGSSVTGWSVGDRVALRGKHASHVLYLASRCVRIPDGVSDEEAAWMGLGKIVQIGVRSAGHALGDNVVVIGLGLLGQLVVQYARLLGADQVIGIDIAEKRRAFADAHGATCTLADPAAVAQDEVWRLTGGRGADIVYDVTGHPSVLASALRLARKHGTVQLLGDAGKPSEQCLSGDLLKRGLRIIGAHDGTPCEFPNEHVRWSTMEMNELFLRYIQRGQIRVKDLVTHRFKPEQAERMYTLLNTDRQNVMGAMIEWA